MDLGLYRGLLINIKKHLERFSVQGWPARIDTWVGELDHLDINQVKDHLIRTKHSLGGMGSIGDIFICPEAGDSIEDDDRIIKSANDDLRNLVEKTYSEVNRLITFLSKNTNDRP